MRKLPGQTTRSARHGQGFYMRQNHIHAACLFVLAAAAFCANAAPGGVDDRLPESEIAPLTLADLFEMKRKEPGFFKRNPTEKTAAEQLARGRRLEEKKNWSDARCAYNGLVRHWHNEPEALQGQVKVAEMCEKLDKYPRAFKEYQYLFTYFSGRFDYHDILARQYQIANVLAGKKRTFFGIPVQSYEEDRLRYEQIAVNAPNSPLAPEVLLKAAAMYEFDRQYAAAADAYARVRVRYAVTPHARTAAYAEARCRHTHALNEPKDDALTQHAISANAAILLQFPLLPERHELEEWTRELRAKREEDAYQQALFYDTIRRQPKAALTAYRDFLLQHPGSPRIHEVRERINQLETQSAPAVQP